MDNGTTEPTCTQSRDDGPAVNLKDAHNTKSSNSMRLPWSSTAKTASHPPLERSVPSSLFSRLGFLRPTEPSSEQWLLKGDAPRSKTSIDDEDGPILRTSVAGDDAHKQAAVKQRKRKGSLRKSALMGVKRMGSGERRNSLLQRSSVQEPEDRKQENTSTTEAKSYGLGLFTETGDPDDTSQVIEASLSKLIALQQDTEPAQPSCGTPPGDMWTTEDDDDVLSFTRPSKPTVPVPALPHPQGAAATSFFPPQSPRLRARSARQLRPSPLQHAHEPAPEPYLYAETEYWGWVILFVTWLVFTVGMGSCLDLWSWAWDVGETPYAPPELEDDPTLPIVGYYPALIVLTGVVAWVWITVAWVGMKYFRHAKIEDIR